MPSHRKRIGFLPSKEVHDLIESISKDNNFSQSRVTGLLVEEALRSRGLLNNLLEENDVITDHKYEDIEIKKQFFTNKKSDTNLNFSSQNKNSLKEELEMINQFIEFKFFKQVMNRKNDYHK